MALDEKVVSSPVVFPTSLRNISVRGYKLAADALEKWYQEQTKTDDLFDFNNMAMFIHQHINDSIMLVHNTRSLDLYLSLGHPGKPLGLIAELTVDRKAKNLLKQIGDSSVNATDHRVEEADTYPAPVPPPPVSENGYEQLVASEFGQKMKALMGRFQVMPEDTPGTLLWDGMPDSFR